MSQPFVGEIRMFAGNFAPAGWMFCAGQLLPISQFETVFTLIGTTYGGDGQTTFALPDLRGRLPVHQGNGFVIGENGGAETVTINTTSMPAHSHPFVGTQTTATGTVPAGNVLAGSTGATVSPYGTDAPLTGLAPQSMATVGGNQPHSNLQPYLCVNFIISMFGVFPSQN